MLKNLEFKKVLNSILFIIYLVTLCFPLSSRVPYQELAEVNTVFGGLNARYGVVTVFSVALFVIFVLKKEGFFKSKEANIGLGMMIVIINLVLTIGGLKYQYSLFVPQSHSYYSMYYINIMCIVALGISKLIAMFETKTVGKGRLVS